jgi:hypothetical protein
MRGDERELAENEEMVEEKKKILEREKKNLNEIENIIGSLMLLGLIRHSLRPKTTNLIDTFFFISISII